MMLGETSCGAFKRGEPGYSTEMRWESGRSVGIRRRYSSLNKPVGRKSPYCAADGAYPRSRSGEGNPTADIGDADGDAEGNGNGDAGTRYVETSRSVDSRADAAASGPGTGAE